MRFVLSHVTLGNTIIPISSMTARIREGTPSYLQVVVPNFTQYSDTVQTYIEHCRESEMKVYKVIGGTTVYDLVTVDLETIRYDQGSISQSIFLTGHRTFYNQAPKSVTIVDGDYMRSGTDIALETTRRVRCSAYNNVTAGDTVTYVYGADTFTFDVALLTFNSSSYGTEMEVSS